MSPAAAEFACVLTIGMMTARLLHPLTRSPNPNPQPYAAPSHPNHRLHPLHPCQLELLSRRYLTTLHAACRPALPYGLCIWRLVRQVSLDTSHIGHPSHFLAPACDHSVLHRHAELHYPNCCCPCSARCRCPRRRCQSNRENLSFLGLAPQTPGRTCPPGHDQELHRFVRDRYPVVRSFATAFSGSSSS